MATECYITIEMELVEWKEATGVLVCHPCAEHLLPLLMIVSSSSSDDTGKEYIDTAVRPS